MGQSADEMRRAEQRRLQQGETAVIRPGVPPTDGDGGSGADDPDAIEAGIEQTRAEMSETIDAIQQRLSPENLKEEVKEQASELAEHAKEAAREAVQHAVHEAKVALRDARDSVRDATIGRVEGMARMVGDTTEDARYGIVETIKQNPFPAALAGIGLAWLFMNRQSAPRRAERRSYVGDQGSDRGYRGYRDREDERYDQARYFRVERDRYGTPYGTYGSGSSSGRDQESGGMMERAQDKVGQAAGQVGDMAGRAGDAIGQAAGTAGDTVSRVAGQVGETAGAAVNQVQETTGQLVGQAQHQMQRAEDRVGRVLQDNPLAVGAVALALGTAVGLAVPQTRRENELFGQARDTLVERAQDLAQETMGKVQEVVAETGQTVQREAQAQGLVGR